VSPTPSHISMASLIVLSLPSGIQKPDQFRIIITGKCEGKVKRHLRLLTHNHRHTPLPLDLLSRADFGEALSLFSRMLDELD
jgi:hypothetical protein